MASFGLDIDLFSAITDAGIPSWQEPIYQDIDTFYFNRGIESVIAGDRDIADLLEDSGLRPEQIEALESTLDTFQEELEEQMGDIVLDLLLDEAMDAAFGIFAPLIDVFFGDDNYDPFGWGW